MTAATINYILETGSPASEAAVLEATNAETYESRKFNTVLGAIISANNTTTACSTTISGSTVTIVGAFTDKIVTLTLWGHAKE